MVAHAVLNFGRTRVTDADAAGTVATFPPFDGVTTSRPTGVGAAFSSHFEYRPVMGAPYSGAAEPLVEGWVRLREPGDVPAPVALLAMIDAWFPAIVPTLREKRPFGTISFAAHVFDRGWIPGEPLFHRARLLASQQGYFAELRSSSRRKASFAPSTSRRWPSSSRRFERNATKRHEDATSATGVGLVDVRLDVDEPIPLECGDHGGPCLRCGPLQEEPSWPLSAVIRTSSTSKKSSPPSRAGAASDSAGAASGPRPPVSRSAARTWRSRLARRPSPFISTAASRRRSSYSKARAPRASARRRWRSRGRLPGLPARPCGSACPHEQRSRAAALPRAVEPRDAGHDGHRRLPGLEEGRLASGVDPVKGFRGGAWVMKLIKDDHPGRLLRRRAAREVSAVAWEPEP